jgi:hypothetical protein
MDEQPDRTNYRLCLGNQSKRFRKLVIFLLQAAHSEIVRAFSEWPKGGAGRIALEAAGLRQQSF